MQKEMYREYVEMISRIIVEKRGKDLTFFGKDIELAIAILEKFRPYLHFRKDEITDHQWFEKRKAIIVSLWGSNGLPDTMEDSKKSILNEFIYPIVPEGL